MSWDHNIKSIKCPCNCGTIEQDIQSDDWGSVEIGTPVIKCPNCKNKYNLITLSYTSLYSWKGGTTNYYLVSKDVDLSVDYIHNYPELNCWEVAEKSFPNALIISYTFNNLQSALIELNFRKSVSSIKWNCF